MATVSSDLSDASRTVEPAYPTSDGRPLGETDLHRTVMVELIEMLKVFYAGQQVYVSGNLLLFYQRGSRRRHVSPDVTAFRDFGKVVGTRRVPFATAPGVCYEDAIRE